VSFTSVLPAPQLLLKAAPPPPTDRARGVDRLVSLAAASAPADLSAAVEALAALAVSLPPPADSAGAADQLTLAGPSAYGYILRLVKRGDVVLPDDQNNVVHAWRAKLEKLEEILDLVQRVRPDAAEVLALRIDELRAIVGRMPLVSEGDWVYSEHFNLHVRALRKLVEIEEWVATEVRRSPPDMVPLLEAMKNRASQLEERKTGDIVAASDWNAVKQALAYAPKLDELAAQLYHRLVVMIGDAPVHSAPSGLTLDIFYSAYGGDPGRDEIMFTDDDLDYAPVVRSLAERGIRVHTVYYPSYTGTLEHDARAHFTYVAQQTGGKMYYGSQDWHRLVAEEIAGLAAHAAVDVVFAVDLTGSMSTHIGDVKAKLKSLVDSVPSGLAVRFGLGSHRDYPRYYSSYGYSANYGFAGDWPWRRHLDLTADRDAVKSAVDRLPPAGGGGDAPECYTRALYECLFFSWQA